MENAADRVRKIRGVVVLAVLLVIAGIWFASCSTPKPYDANNSAEVIAQCEAQITEHLKSPSTAKFHSTSSSTGETTWTVNGTVDSQNGFGAMVRSTYECSVTVDSAESITTKIESLKSSS